VQGERCGGNAVNLSYLHWKELQAGFLPARIKIGFDTTISLDPLSRKGATGVDGVTAGGEN
jgi:hypothetical protein